MNLPKLLQDTERKFDERFTEADIGDVWKAAVRPLTVRDFLRESQLEVIAAVRDLAEGMESDPPDDSIEFTLGYHRAIAEVLAQLLDALTVKDI